MQCADLPLMDIVNLLERAVTGPFGILSCPTVIELSLWMA